MPRVVVPSCALAFIYIPKRWVLCIQFLCGLMMRTYNRVHYGPMVIFICLLIKLPHYHHYKDLSESIELLKCLSGNSVTRVSNIYSILTIIFHAIFGAVLIELTHFSYNDENTYIVSHYHHQIGIMAHLPLSR